MSETQKKALEQQLWKIADTLRGTMDADEYKNYMLGFIFYKYLSEKMVSYANEALKTDNILFTEIDENNTQGKEILKELKHASTETLGYFLTPNELFSKVAAKGNLGSPQNIILGDLQDIFKDIEQSTMGTESEEDFNDLFKDIDLTSTKLGKNPEERNEIIVKILTDLDKVDFDLGNLATDVLGDAYEYLIGQFASGAGKKAGEFYTPQPVSQILAKIVTLGKNKEIKQIKSVYDPTCGSGSLLLRVARMTSVDEIYGQEKIRTTYNLARMNMIMHSVHHTRFDIRQDDTLQKPQHKDKKFEAIVANPPFSAIWKADIIKETDDRFSQYGKLAPASKADFAFVQHMIYHLAENGTMACVLPHGVLFRGGAENVIRKHLIENKNYIDAIIGLPANIFYGTSIPTCILVLKKCRENPDNILFIDASKHFEKVKNQNFLRDEDIERIFDTYKNRNEIHQFSRLATLKEVKDNEYNLNIPRYVDTFEQEDNINLQQIAAEINDTNRQMSIIDQQIADFCKQLEINPPL